MAEITELPNVGRSLEWELALFDVLDRSIENLISELQTGASCFPPEQFATFASKLLAAWCTVVEAVLTEQLLRKSKQAGHAVSLSHSGLCIE